MTVYLYLDDGDGIFEPGVDDVLVATKVTSGDGSYLFDMLLAGSYWVDVDETTLPAGLTLTVGTDPLLVTVNYSDNYLDADFGYSGADLSIVKLDGADPVAVGGVLTYTLTISNSGPSYALNVVVTDTLPTGLTFVAATPPQASGPNPLVWNLGTIPVGESRTIVVTTTVSASTGGTVVNEAEVATTTPDPVPTNNYDSEPTLIIKPGVDIQKMPDLQQAWVGDTVTFTIRVENTGDATLAPVVVTDTLAPDCNRTFLSLAASQALTYTCTVTNVTTDFTNVAYVAGTPPAGPDVTDSDTAAVDVIHPAIRIVKTPGATQVPPGTQVTYIYATSNVGDVPLANVTVTDDQCSPVTPIPPTGYNVGDTNNNGLLDVGETWQYRCSAVLTEDTTNTATASAVDPLDRPVSDDDTAFVNVLKPGLDIAKVADPTVVYPGTTVSYTYTVTNPGSDPAYNVQVTDDKCSPVVYQGGDTNTNNALDVGETWTYTCSTTLTVDTVNTATVTGKDALGNPVSPDQDTATVDVINPAIALSKTGPAASWLGATNVYTFVVTNVGDTPLSGITVTDTLCGAATYVSGDDGDGWLELTESWTFTCTYQVQSGDPDPLPNTATARGTDLLGGQVSATDDWSTDLVFCRIGDMTFIDMNSNGVYEPGTDFGFGNVPLHITGLDANGATVDITVTTSITGYYLVENLLPGTYTVTAPAVYSGHGLVSASPLTTTLTPAASEDLSLDFIYAPPTAVNLLALEAAFEPGGQAVRMRWVVESGVGEVTGFLVYRSDNPKGPFERITAEPIPANRPGLAEYEYLDTRADPARAYWYALQVLPGGSWLGPIATSPYAPRRAFLPFLPR